MTIKKNGGVFGRNPKFRNVAVDTLTVGGALATFPATSFTAARTDAAQSFTGNQTLATGNLVIGTAGKGIDFTADPSAAGMANELLDDYEEGTWTPSLVPVTSGSISLSVANGRYTKIGNMVTVTATIVSNGVTSPVGGLRLDGLPFFVGGNGGGTFAPYAYGLAATATTTLVGFAVPASSSADIAKYGSGTLSNLAADVQNGSGMYLSFSYFV